MLPKKMEKYQQCLEKVKKLHYYLANLQTKVSHLLFMTHGKNVTGEKDRQIFRCIQIDRKKDGWLEIGQTDIQLVRKWMDRQIDEQIDRQIDRQINRQIDRQIDR